MFTQDAFKAGQDILLSINNTAFVEPTVEVKLVSCILQGGKEMNGEKSSNFEHSWSLEKHGPSPCFGKLKKASPFAKYDPVNLKAVT